jgi:hypothetical protein
VSTVARSSRAPVSAENGKNGEFELKFAPCIIVTEGAVRGAAVKYITVVAHNMSMTILFSFCSENVLSYKI